MSDNTVEKIDNTYLARAQDLSQGICRTVSERGDYDTLVAAAAAKGCLPEELPEWPIGYQHPRRVMPEDPPVSGKLSL